MHRKLQTGAALLVAVAALGAPALGQSDAREATERCRALPTDTARFACMEQLVLDLAPPSPPAESAPPAEAVAVAPAAVAAPDPVEPDARGSDGRRLFRLPFTGRGDAVVEAPAPPAPAPQSLGAERLEASSSEQSERETLAAHVVAFEEAPYQRLRVELDNGQVWEQREADPPWREEQYGAPEAVEIFASRFGGYRMRLVGKNLTLSVDRVR